MASRRASGKWGEKDGDRNELGHFSPSSLSSPASSVPNLVSLHASPAPASSAASSPSSFHAGGPGGNEYARRRYEYGSRTATSASGGGTGRGGGGGTREDPSNSAYNQV